MSRSSEDILLQVTHVKNKKSDGVLFVMETRIAWMISNKDSFSINHKYTDIKSQKISPEGKAKVQLQIVLHDGTNTTFHFGNPLGREAQILDRDKAKDLLLTLLPKFKKKINKELEEKNRKLTENPGLLQLYKDLVITSIITADDFWATHGKLNSSGGNSLDIGMEVGVSGSFLSEIKPQADGANGLKYNLTNDIIESIFKTYPAVKRKHSENVPTLLSEQEFWTKFFQSHYFHRDRIHHKGVKDLFTECAKEDDKQIKLQLQSGVEDQTANMCRFTEDFLDEHYGSAESPLDKNSINIVHTNIIKRFNHHSIMVMNVSRQSGGEEEDSSLKRTHRLSAKGLYDDLVSEPESKISKLNLTKTDRYLNGPTLETSASYLTSDELRASQILLTKDLVNWRNSRTDGVLSSVKALKTLTDLTPGGALMNGGRNQALAESCPPEVTHDLKQLYSSLSELLRHFWSCFPPTSPQLQEKANKMMNTLKKFESIKVRPFEYELTRTYNSGAKMTHHIHRMLASAYNKYNNWSQKKIR